MATRKEKAKLEKVTINLFAADTDYLKQVYSTSGYSKAIRVLVQKHVARLRKIIKEKQGKINLEEVEFLE